MSDDDTAERLALLERALARTLDELQEARRELEAALRRCSALAEELRGRREATAA